MSLIASDHRKLSNALQIAIPKKTKGSRKATLLSFTKLSYLRGILATIHIFDVMPHAVEVL